MVIKALYLTHSNIRMIQQIKFTLPAMRRGCHLITADILDRLPELPERGLVNIFVCHTSCGLTITENSDPDVRSDMARILDRIVPESHSAYDHSMEGLDDMPAHAKSSLFGVSLTIPIVDHRLALGTWQGICLCEFRDYGGPRKLIVTLYA